MKPSISNFSLLAVLSFVLLGGWFILSVDHADAGGELPIERLWALEQRSTTLEDNVAKLHTKMDLITVSIERIESQSARRRTIRIDPDSTGRLSGVAELVNPLAKDLNDLRDELQKLKQELAIKTKKTPRPSDNKTLNASIPKAQTTSDKESVHKAQAFSPQSTSLPPSSNRDPIELLHWLTEQSGVRHNQSCKWFKTSRGRFTTPDDGRPCAHCGG